MVGRHSVRARLRLVTDWTPARPRQGQILPPPTAPRRAHRRVLQPIFCATAGAPPLVLCPVFALTLRRCQRKEEEEDQQQQLEQTARRRKRPTNPYLRATLSRELNGGSGPAQAEDVRCLYARRLRRQALFDLGMHISAFALGPTTQGAGGRGASVIVGTSSGNLAFVLPSLAPPSHPLSHFSSVRG